MAIVINTNPAANASVNNEMLFVVYEATKANDDATYPDYRYVADVYVDGVMVGRLTARPDPTYKRGIFDVAPILRSYVAAYGLNASSNKVDYTIRLAYTVKFGEEYDAVFYPNVTVDSERYTVKTYKARPFNSSVIIANGLASNMPSVVTSYREELYQIVPYFSNVSGVLDVDLRGYGDPVSLWTNETIDNSDFVANKIRQYNLSTSQIRGESRVVYSEVTQPFYLKTNFICSKYPVITLAWLNPYGGYESQQFGFVSKKTNEVSRKSYGQLNYKINSSGEVSYDSNNVYYGSKRGFASLIKPSMKLTSHYPSDNEYKWWADLFSSPDVYMYHSEFAKFIPVTITESNYEVKTYLNSRLKPLEFSIEFTDEYNSQYL